MVDHSFEDAVDAFTRINSLGVRLKQQDIESARIAARHSGLIADEIMPFMEHLATSGLKRLKIGDDLFRVCVVLARPGRNSHANPTARTPAGRCVAGMETD